MIIFSLISIGTCKRPGEEGRLNFVNLYAINLQETLQNNFRKASCHQIIHQIHLQIKKKISFKKSIIISRIVFLISRFFLS